MTTEDRKREIFAQPSAAKEVYARAGRPLCQQCHMASSGGLMAYGTCSTSRLIRKPGFDHNPPPA